MLCEDLIYITYMYIFYANVVSVGWVVECECNIPIVISVSIRSRRKLRGVKKMLALACSRWIFKIGLDHGS